MSKIKDLKAGDIGEGYFYIKLSEQKTTTTNNKYMDFVFSDNTGDINAKLWDWDETNVTRFAAGNVIWAKGQVIDWQGQLQFKIERIRRTNDNDQVDPSDFIPSAPYKGEDMYKLVEEASMQIENQDIKNIVSTIIKRYKDRLLYYPAAKRNHHSVRSGLLYHIATMLRNAASMAKIYPFLNKDLLYAGVILHDIGKIEEMDTNDFGIVTDYNLEGIMIGHLIQGVKLISQVAEEVKAPKEISNLLEHMILSHHYIPEHGSPKPPMFPEAELLHYLDIIDARMYDMEKIYEQTEEGDFSEKIWSLNNRQIYKHKLHNK